MTYEEALAELDKVVEKLSNEKLGVEESLRLYSQGIAAAKTAMDLLNEFKGKIELLNKDFSALNVQLDEEDVSDDDDE